MTSTSQDKKWQPLQKGDTIDLVAPASIPNTADFPKIKRVIEAAGYKASFTYAPIDPVLGYANTIEKRASSFHGAMSNPNSKAVWAIRGGAGSTRLWKMLNTMPTPAMCKPLIGFSDITGLHSYVGAAWQFPSVHAIVAEYNKEMGSVINRDQSVDTLFALLSGQTKSISYKMKAINEAALESGGLRDVIITGGNGTLVTSTLGSRFSPSKRGQCIVMLETIGATLHQLERVFDAVTFGTGLLSAGHNVKAIVVGETLISEEHPNTREEQAEFNDGITRLGQLIPNVPIYSAPIFGHGAVNKPLILGATSSISASKGGKAQLSFQNPSAREDV